MKKILTFFITTAILLTTFSSCSLSPNDKLNISELITVSMSSASEYGIWLTERLGDEITEKLILGIGSSDSYDVDMSTFEDDGYIIRSDKDETVIFGKTEVGLDLACRRYANDIDIYGSSFETVYHEGYRIDEIRLFGKSISDFKIEYPAGSDANTLFAVSELVRLVEIACGAVLPQSAGISESSSVIRFVPNSSELKNGAYRYYESNENLIFEYSDNAESAVYAFLENECGWNGLSYGDSLLTESQLIDIARGIDVTETPAFGYFSSSLSYENDRGIPSASQRSKLPVSHASNGMAKHDFAEMGAAADKKQICYTDQEVFDTVLDNVKKYIRSLQNTENTSSVTEVDISQSIDGEYCLCDGCQEVIAEEGSTAGVVVRFANKLSEKLSKEYPDTAIKILADKYTSVPPVTPPIGNVYVTFSYEDGCNNHALSGIECESDNSISSSNILLSERLRGWLGLTDKVYVTYSSGEGIFSSLDTVYKDMLYLYNSGVMGVYRQIDNSDSVIYRIEDQLCAYLNRNIDMGSEKFDELLCDLLYREFGDGWHYIRNLVADISEIKKIDECSSNFSGIKYDTFKYSGMFNALAENTEAAILLSCSVSQERNSELLSCRIIYEGCFSSYFNAYYSEDKEKIKSLENKYSVMLERLEKNGISDSLPSDLYSIAWEEWEEFKNILCNVETPSYEDNDINTLREYCDIVNEHTAANRLTFAFSTDTHYTSEATASVKNKMVSDTKSMMRITRYADIDLFVNGGDLINGDQSTCLLALDSLTEATTMFKGTHTNIPMVFLRGNHDDNTWYSLADNEGKRYDIYHKNTVLTSSDWRNYFTNNAPEIVTDDEGSYGYYDHEASKIRILFLDTSDIPYEDIGNGYYKYGAYAGHGIRQDQLEFMANAMLFSDKGEDASEWAILVLSHVPVETMKAEGYRFGTKDASGRNFYAFLRILKAYQKGTVFDEAQVNPTNYGDGGYLTTDLKWNDTAGDFAYDIYADYSANGPGEVIGFISGHTHIDNYSNEVGKVSYTNPIIYPELSCGYSYIATSSRGITTFTVERNGDGTGYIYADRMGRSIVPYEDMISDGDNAVVSTDPVATGMITSDPYAGSVASGHYTVYYSQHR